MREISDKEKEVDGQRKVYLGERDRERDRRLCNGFLEREKNE